MSKICRHAKFDLRKMGDGHNLKNQLLLQRIDPEKNRFFIHYITFFILYICKKIEINFFNTSGSQ